jgi:hypothetical protein
MVAKMRVEFADLSLTYSIGGQISFDVFPQVKQHTAPALGTMSHVRHVALEAGGTGGMWH